MNRTAIFSFLIVTLDKEQGDYICQSPLCPSIIGIGSSADEARKQFRLLVNDLYVRQLDEKQSKRNPGRPQKTKGYAELHAQVRPDLKQELSSLAQEFGLSQGEAIEFLYRCYKLQQECTQKGHTLITV